MTSTPSLRHQSARRTMKSKLSAPKSQIRSRRPLFETLENRSLLAAIAPPDGLVSWWTGDNTAADLAGVHNGTLSGGAAYTSGKVGQAFSFDGINDTVLLAGTFGGGTEATIEAWVKSTGSTGDFQAIVSAVESQFVHLQLGTGGNNVAYTNGDVVGFPIIQTTPAGEFRHVAMSLKSGDSRLYVNGELLGVSPVTYSTLLPTSNLRIGSGYLGGRYFKGQIDEVSYYDRALSATEVQHIYSADSAGKIKSAVYIAANAVSVSEGAAGSNSVATFTLERVGNLSGPVTVDWSTADGTASGTSDFVSASGQITFENAQSQQTVQVVLNGDDVPEADESFKLLLSMATPGYQTGEGFGAILNDDLGISISDTTATEGGTALRILDRFVQANSGGLARPRAPLFGPDANADAEQDLYVVSADTSKILLYDGQTGDFLRTFVEDVERLVNPGDIAFGPDGDLYVSSIGTPTGAPLIPGAGKVLRYDGTTGDYLNTIMTGLSHPLGVTVDTSGTVYAASQDSDQIYRTKGGVTSVFISAGSGGLDQPRNVLVGPDITGDGQADLYVSSQSYDGVLRYNGQTGAFIDKFASTGLGSGPSWIEFAPDGSLVATAGTTGTCCNISYIRFDGTTGAKIDQLDTTTLGWAFRFGPDGLIYSVYMTAGLESYVGRIGPTSFAAFTVSLNATSATPVSVDYATADGTAAAGDFTASSGTITFAPGETSRVILVPTLDDAAVEVSEAFTVNLSNTVGAVIAEGSGTATITDDDASRTISISDATANEGANTARFIDVPIGTPSSPIDHPKQIVKGTDGDYFVTSATTNSVARYDGVTFQYLGDFVSPGQGGLFDPIGLVFANGDLFVASAGTDAVLRYDGQTGAFIEQFIPSGAFGIDRPTDLVVRNNELYVSAWSGGVHRYDLATGAFLGIFVTGMDDPAGIAFGPDGNFYVVEFAPGGNNAILRFDGSTGAFIDEFVPEGSDGLTSPSTITFGPDGHLYVVQNSDVSRFHGQTGAFLDIFIPQGLGGIVSATRLTFVGNQAFLVNSGNDQVIRYDVPAWAAFTVSLSSPSSSLVAVSYAINSGTATAGSDYTSATGTITFAPGQTSRTILVPTNDDLATESNETFTVVLSAAQGGVIIDDTVVGTIIDNDTKFYVVDDAATNRTFEYNASGSALENYAVTSSNSAPRGAASTAAGNKVWVVDANRTVYVYNPSGALLGSWSIGGFNSSAQLEGIATNGTDIWIVDNKSDKVYRFTGAANRIAGSQSAASSFALNSANKDASDVVTDGTSIWVLNNTSSTDKVFKYTVSGTLQGSWTISGGGGSPTGLTIDPTGGTDMWIVDSNTDRVYQFTDGRATTPTITSPATSFPLAAGNTNPQGIADPPTVGSSGPEEPGLPNSSTSSNDSPHDAALLSLTDELDSFLATIKRRR